MLATLLTVAVTCLQILLGSLGAKITQWRVPITPRPLHKPHSPTSLMCSQPFPYSLSLGPY